MVPITYAETPEQVEEERRLLYVGATRAREHLALSWAVARSPGARGGRRPSRFIDGLWPDDVRRAARGPGPAHGAGPASEAGATRRRARAAAARCRVCGKPLVDAVPRKLGRCEDCPSSMDEALFERLKAWRLERAREQSLPAFCIFTDATLTAIAESTPVTEQQLAAIPGVGRAKLDKYAADVIALCVPNAVPQNAVPPNAVRPESGGVRI